MMKLLKQIRPGILLISAFFLLTLFSCSLLEDPETLGPQGKDRYEDPPWLGGSIIDTLENNPDYSIFIELMDKAGFRNTITQQLFTVFVPNNDAFEAYFQSAGISGIADMTEAQGQQLFSLHMLENARTRFQLVFEFAFNELQDDRGEYGALFFRRQTKSQSLPTPEFVKYTPQYAGEELLTITGNKYMPVFSTSFIKTYGGNPDGSDYSYFYRNSTWGNNVNWGNANVTSAEVRTSSGFIYFIDQVVPPMQNIDEYLRANQDRFGLFYDVAQRFAGYNYSKVRVSDKAKLYTKRYSEIFNICDEGAQPDNGTQAMRTMFNAIVPSNDAFQKYLDERFSTFESIDSMPKITLKYIVQSQLTHALGLISQMEKFYTNVYGDRLDVSRADFNDAHMCSNGAVYESNRFIEPNVFTCVPGNLFFNEKYSSFLQMLDYFDLINLLTDPLIKVTLFGIDNDALERANYRYDDISNKILFRGTDGFWNPIVDQVIVQNFVEDHISLTEISDLSGEGYIQMLSGNYFHYNNGVLDAGRNTNIGVNANIIGTTKNERNGYLYDLDNAIESNYTFGQILTDEPDFSEFTNLLIGTNLLNPFKIDPVSEDTIPTLNFIGELEWTGFIPDNSAMQKAYSEGLDTTEILTNVDLKNFLLYHFVREETIFDDGVITGAVNSNALVEDLLLGVVYLKMNVENSPGNLSITDISGQEVKVSHNDANKLVKSGAVHKIPSVLKINN